MTSTPTEPTARETFVARFGEDQAAAIEQAARGHISSPFSDIHDNDNLGSDPFRYWFLGAIGYECVTRFRDDHGITADVEEMRAWALGEGNLGAHDGDIPDYLALMCGVYNDWVRDPDAPAEVSA